MAEAIQRAKIYLSCHPSDHEEVEALAAFLEDLGFQPSGFWGNIRQNTRTSTTEQQYIREAHFFIACLSKRSFKRKSPVPREMQEARKVAAIKPAQEQYLTLARLKECPIPPAWGNIHRINFFESDGWEIFAEKVKQNLKHYSISFQPRFRVIERSDLSPFEAGRMIRLKELFHNEWNDAAKRPPRQYSRDGKNTERIIIDGATGLMWQRYPSTKFMEAREAREHVRQLNLSRWCGYEDWRLPTLDEAMTLMERIIDKDFFLNPHFFDPSPWILTADQYEGQTWLVNYKLGICSLGHAVTGVCVRAVRTFQS